MEKDSYVMASMRLYRWIKVAPPTRQELLETVRMLLADNDWSYAKQIVCGLKWWGRYPADAK